MQNYDLKPTKKQNAPDITYELKTSARFNRHFFAGSVRPTDRAGGFFRFLDRARGSLASDFVRSNAYQTDILLLDEAPVRSDNFLVPRHTKVSRLCLSMKENE